MQRLRSSPEGAESRLQASRLRIGDARHRGAADWKEVRGSCSRHSRVTHDVGRQFCVVRPPTPRRPSNASPPTMIRRGHLSIASNAHTTLSTYPIPTRTYALPTASRLAEIPECTTYNLSPRCSPPISTLFDICPHAFRPPCRRGRQAHLPQFRRIREVHHRVAQHSQAANVSTLRGTRSCSTTIYPSPVGEAPPMDQTL